MPNGDPRDRFFYPTPTLMIDSYSPGKPGDAKRRSSERIFLSYPHTYHRFLYCLHFRSNYECYLFIADAFLLYFSETIFTMKAVSLIVIFCVLLAFHKEVIVKAGILAKIMYKIPVVKKNIRRCCMQIKCFSPKSCIVHFNYLSVSKCQCRYGIEH